MTRNRSDGPPVDDDFWAGVQRRARRISALRIGDLNLGEGETSEWTAEDAPDTRRRALASLGPASLSRREREVARLAAQGLTARQIAKRLFISERTVETHLTNVYAKLGVESKMDLVHRAAELGF
jgi:DNA-binding CsgD family transcriptional regulator